MSRARSSKKQKSASSFASQDYKSYFAAAEPLNELEIGIEESSSQNGSHLSYEIPSNHTLLQLPSNDVGNKSRKSAKKHRKRSFNEPPSGMVIREVEEENKPEINYQAQRIKSEAVNDKYSFDKKSRNHPSEDIDNKSNFVV